MPQPLFQEKIRIAAINTLLMTIGENPVERVEDYEILQEARNASTVLDEVTLAVLSESWDFNSDDNKLLPTDVDGLIAIPYNTLDVGSDDGDLLSRGWKLYSKSKQSHIFDGPQTVNLVWSMPFEELTHPIRHYITIRAARIFAARTIGDYASYSYSAADEQSAMYSARQSESRTADFNMLKNMDKGR